MSGPSVENTQLKRTFWEVTAKPNIVKSGHKTKPFTIRFTDEERAILEHRAGRRPLGTYCRDQLLGTQARERKVQHRPKLGQEQYAALLAALGESRLSSNLNQLAKSANMGTLDVSQDVEQQLEEAYAAILAMRDALLTALEIKRR